MSDFDSKDFFSDVDINEDPLPYFEYLRSKCPVSFETTRSIYFVTGFDEAAELFGKKAGDFSNSLCIAGPTVPLPFTPEGNDISDQIRENRDKVPWSTHFITFDPPEHTAHRGLLTRLLTHERLKRNEQYMERLADELIDRFIEKGRCEIVADYGQAMATLEAVWKIGGGGIPLGVGL